ncbi:hypothetical protein D3C86_1523610 [compost metagenome]
MSSRPVGIPNPVFFPVLVIAFFGFFVVFLGERNGMTMFYAFFHIKILQRTILDLRFFSDHFVVEDIFGFPVVKETGPFTGFFTFFVVPENIWFPGREIRLPFPVK